MRCPTPLCAFAVLALLFATHTHANTEWTLVEEAKGIRVFAREKPGSSVKELRAEGVLNAPAAACKAVLDDVENYNKTMPYMHSVEVLDRGPKTVTNYQRLAPPLASDRDYVVKVTDSSGIDDKGRMVYRLAWEPAPGGPPPVEGVVRVTKNEGSWELVALDGGGTQATYTLFTDPGGMLPAFLVNKANTQGLPDLFQAIERAALRAPYRNTRPTTSPRDVPATQPGNQSTAP